MSSSIIQAVYAAYPSVVGMRIEDGVIEAEDSSGNPVAIDMAKVQAESVKIDCKEKAKTLISKTDWSALPDVTIKNKEDFVAYRAALRSLIINPVSDPTWPEEPNPIWE